MNETITIGGATLIHGDSLELLRAGVLPRFDAIVMDPPYGIGFQHGGGGASAFAGNRPSRRKSAPIAGDSEAFDPTPWVKAAPFTKDTSGVNAGKPRIVLWGADRYMQRLPEGGTMLAWDKHLGHGPDDSFTDCEWAWCGRTVKREVFRWLWKGIMTKKDQRDCFLANGKGARGNGAAAFARAHVSQKPVELMRWSIEKLKVPAGGTILDPFMGSGTTGVAALSLGSKFIGVEIEDRHFQVACDRIKGVVDGEE